MDCSDFELIQLKNGAWSVRSKGLGETFHPVLGPGAEAELLYVDQSGLRRRLKDHHGDFVVWDVGLGAAANATAVVRAAAEAKVSLHLTSFDATLAPLALAIENAAALRYLDGFEGALRRLMDAGVASVEGPAKLHWRFVDGDFPTLLRNGALASLPKPHFILFDPFSPARNPAMWTGALFEELFRAIDPTRPCGLATYSRSTSVRAALLLAGFFVGRGGQIADKEETTVAANRLELAVNPLPASWLERVRFSTSAEPLVEGTYRQAPISPSNWERLRRHPQFGASTAAADLLESASQARL